jgi:AAA15 family ATPase/GTPase
MVGPGGLAGPDGGGPPAGRACLPLAMPFLAIAEKWKYNLSTMIKITDIAIENYRGIRTGRIDNLGDVNILVGKNGSGKSTFLEPILLVSHAFQPRPEPDFYEDSRLGHLTKLDFIAIRRNLSANEYGTYEIDGKTLHSIEFNSENWWYAGKWEQKIIFRFEFADEKLVMNNQKGQPGKIIDLPSDEVREFISQVMFVDGSFVSRRSVEDKAWDHILMKALKEKVIEHFNGVYPLQIKDINYSKKGLIVTPRNTKYGIFLDNLGSGMRIGIRLMMVLSILSGTAVIIEEFDAYQHPESLSAIIKIVFETAASNKLQFFFTTHRMESIRGFLEHYGSYTGLEGRIVGTALSADGVLTSRSIPFQDADKLFSSGFDFRNFEDHV